MELLPFALLREIIDQTTQSTSAASTGLSGGVPSITPDWLTAVGTLLAVIVALAISFGGVVSRYLYRPKLSIDYRNEEPFARTANLAVKVEKLGVARYAIVGTARFIRVRITNNGRSIARECEGRVARLHSLTAANIWEEAKDFDPVFLHWVGHDETAISMNRGAYEYLDIGYVDSRTPTKFHIYESVDQLRGIILDRVRGTYRIDLVLYCPQTKPVEEKYVVTFAASSFTAVKMEKFNPSITYYPLPPPANTQPGAYQSGGSASSPTAGSIVVSGVSTPVSTS